MPVRPAAVATSNIADAELDPVAVFDRSSDPLDVPRGGTGIGVVPDRALLVGGGAGPASAVPGVTFGDGVLSAPSLAVGTWRFAASNDEAGRRTVLAVDSGTGCNVDLLQAGKHDVRPPQLSVTPGSNGQVTVEGATADDLVRVIHFDWRLSPSDDRTSAQVARAPSKSVRVDATGVARYTATGLTAAATYDFRAAAEDGRGNVSEVSWTTGASLS